MSAILNASKLPRKRSTRTKPLPLGSSPLPGPSCPARPTPRLDDSLCASCSYQAFPHPISVRVVQEQLRGSPSHRAMPTLRSHDPQQPTQASSVELKLSQGPSRPPDVRFPSRQLLRKVDHRREKRGNVIHRTVLHAARCPVEKEALRAVKLV